ncbi:MAG TPA: hypothetical protein VM142_05215 [Acidimicrobiales bacterium]|nr:hypothetical protein [Acidimicrobiales bacterium]
MPPLQKLLAALLGGLVLSLVVVLAGVAYVRSGGETKLKLTQAPTAISTIPTLDGEPQPQEKDLVEETTTTSSTTTTTTTIFGMGPDTTTSGPPATRLAPAIDGSGAVLLPAGAPGNRELAAGASCQGLADPNASEVRCELFRAKGGDLIWLTQSTREGVLGSGRGRSFYVFERAGSNSWRIALEKVDVGGSQFKSVNVRVVDVSGDGSQDAVFGFRSASSGLLAVDVVEGPGIVTAHRDATNGSARVSTGQLDVWSASGASAIHEVIRVVGSSYRIVSSEQVASSEVPPSQL